MSTYAMGVWTGTWNQPTHPFQCVDVIILAVGALVVRVGALAWQYGNDVAILARTC